MSNFEVFHGMIRKYGEECTTLQRGVLNAAIKQAVLEVKKETESNIARLLAADILVAISKLPDDREKEKMRLFWAPIAERLRRRAL